MVSVHKAHVFFRWPRTSRVAHILGGGPGKPEAKIQGEAQREPAACKGGGPVGRGLASARELSTSSRRRAESREKR